MKKLKIEEVIVVEGKHDMERLAHCVEADVIVSNGRNVSKQFLDLCDRLNKTRGIIVFTDPDGPGEAIRRRIIEHVGTCKHASLSTVQAKKKQKVGIEHADTQDILDALNACAHYAVEKISMKYNEFIDLGLSGGKGSQEKRDRLSEHFSFPRSNAKTCFKYLNMLGISKGECAVIVEDLSI
ncbi:MAG: ribonuclease M5 [Erysipelothrix sp.]|nr:ribonuclease M5 [Erysipelothrix sp.]